MCDEKILDIDKTPNENFTNILKAVEYTLGKVCEPFYKDSPLNSSEELIRHMRYDYNSLYVTTVCSLLTLLSVTYAEELPLSEVINRMSGLETGEGSVYDMNRNRVRRIAKEYNERNERNLAYFNTSGYTPKRLSTDALWYSILSDFPMLKRFLHNEEAIITKEIFDELNYVYEKINACSGYTRFFLMHKLEMSSKFEMFYKVLSLIKKEKRRKKLPDTDVQKMLGCINDMHVISYNPWLLPGGLYVIDNAEFFVEIVMGTKPGEKTLNAIVLNADKLIDGFVVEKDIIIFFVHVLNFLHNATAFHLCEKIKNELNITDNKFGFEFIESIQQSDKATEFFDDFINKNNHINMNKNCSEDITFTHFKKVYKIKPEKQVCK